MTITDQSKVRLSISNMIAIGVALVVQTAFIVAYQERRFNIIENSEAMTSATVMRLDRQSETHDTRLREHETRIIRLEK